MKKNVNLFKDSCLQDLKDKSYLVVKFRQWQKKNSRENAVEIRALRSILDMILRDRVMVRE